MEKRIIDLLNKVFEGTEITADSSQETVAEWDSMHQLAIAFKIESEFGISLEPEELAKLKSVKDIILFVESNK